jgi:serine O-acetyltransferase
VPAYCTVVGIRGKIVQPKGSRKADPHGIDLDHHLIPDPVGKAVQCLLDRIEALEDELVKPRVDAARECRRCDGEAVCREPAEAES